MTIYKYILDAEAGPQLKVEMPIGASVISCGLDLDDNIAVWAAVDEKREEETRTFYCLWTGVPIEGIVEHPEATTFVGTVRDGAYVWHIFTEIPALIRPKDGNPFDVRVVPF